MDVHPGTRLGCYEVVELIGEGGMGSVYRANDTRLGREVALKLVRSPLVDSEDRLARFTREARLLASLNHPHIATIHGLEESGGVRFLVLELVPGATLAERILRGPLPVGEVLVLGAQIAAAVEAAHERGIIHRDLKPANIKVTPDGNVKVLDFGLAKALSPDSQSDAFANAATVPASGTGAGVVLGTAAYMSPEQARGSDVDKRTDIWACGCVLFDMLTGRSAFGASTGSDTIAAVLTRDPDWSRLPRDLPAPIRCLLRRMLVKDPHRRLHDIGDARIELEDAIAAGADPSAPISGEHRPVPMPRRRVVQLAGGILAVAVLAGAAGWMLKPSARATDSAPVQFALPLPVAESLDGLDFPAIAMSPLGTHVAYVSARGGQQRLFVRPLSALDAYPVAGTEGAFGPFFSPKGEWIGFFSSGKLKKVQVTGGPVLTICNAPIGFGGAWASDGTIVFAPDNGSAILQVSADGGDPHAVTKLDTARGEFSHRWPELVPDAGLLLYTIGTEGSWDDAAIVVQPLNGGERRTVVQGGTNPKYMPDGRLLFARGGSVYAVPLGAGSGPVSALASPVLAGVLESSDGAMQLSVSRQGAVVYLTGESGEAKKALVWVDRQGNVQPLAAPEGAYASPRLSPDGRRLALAISGADRDDIWIYDIGRNASEQLTFEGGTSPIWTSAGRRILFSASRGGPPNLFWRPVDGSGTEERLTNSPRNDMPGSASSDGRTIAYVESDTSGGRDILLLNADERTSRPFVETPSNEMAPALSPDGQWVAFVSDESGRNEVYVSSVVDPRRRMKVSAGGGSEPVWRPRDGPELFFRSGNQMLAASVTLRPGLSVKPPVELFRGEFDTGSAARPAYDVSAEGTRFVMVGRGPNAHPLHELRVILRWAAPSVAPGTPAAQSPGGVAR